MAGLAEKEDREFWLKVADLSFDQINFILRALSPSKALTIAPKLLEGIADLLENPRDPTERAIADFLKKIVEK